MTEEELTALRREIEARHGTVYRFCRDRKVSKGVVYWLLQGRYGGNVERQVARIRAALDGAADPDLFGRVQEALLQAACRRCGRSEQARKRWCPSCRTLAREQARAVADMISQVG